MFLLPFLHVCMCKRMQMFSTYTYYRFVEFVRSLNQEIRMDRSFTMLDLWVPTGVESGAIAALSAGKLPANGSNQLPELPIFWCFFAFFKALDLMLQLVVPDMLIFTLKTCSIRFAYTFVVANWMVELSWIQATTCRLCSLYAFQYVFFGIFFVATNLLLVGG